MNPCSRSASPPDNVLVAGKRRVCSPSNSTSASLETAEGSLLLQNNTEALPPLPSTLLFVTQAALLQSSPRHTVASNSSRISEWEPPHMLG